jgi:hypothetical protein
MEPTLPFWFKQRQAKLEPVGEKTFKVTAPNQGEAYLQLRPGENGCWAAALRATPDGADLDRTEPEFEKEDEAWQAAFELYRRNLVV